jgi:hypothetical protein
MGATTEVMVPMNDSLSLRGVRLYRILCGTGREGGVYGLVVYDGAGAGEAIPFRRSPGTPTLKQPR